MTTPLLMFGILLLVAGAPHVPAAPALLTRHQGTLLPAAMLLLPLLPTLWGEAPGYRLVFPPALRDLRPGLLTALVVLPVFHLLVVQGWVPAPRSSVHLAWEQVPWFALVHTLQVVLPEELFFRAYLQDRLESGATARLLGLPLSRGVLLQALAFGLLHVVAFGLRPAALDRAVPGLLFGMVRRRSPNIWSPVLLHLLCNLWLYLR